MIRDEYGIIILAAGNSSRLGEPKQLLQFNGQSLIRHITCAALETVGENTVVVTGSSSALIERELSGLPCTLAFNENWGEGMSASIKTGIRTPQLRNPQIKGDNSGRQRPAICFRGNIPCIDSTFRRGSERHCGLRIFRLTRHARFFRLFLLSRPTRTYRRRRSKKAV
jgi:hypothetical protein